MEMIAPIGVRNSWLTVASSSGLGLIGRLGFLLRLPLLCNAVDQGLNLAEEIVWTEVLWTHNNPRSCVRGKASAMMKQTA